eukprot:2584043-Rhodomonas_salina.3
MKAAAFLVQTVRERQLNSPWTEWRQARSPSRFPGTTTRGVEYLDPKCRIRNVTFEEKCEIRHNV